MSIFINNNVLFFVTIATNLKDNIQPSTLLPQYNLILVFL